ncbi:hypothetical protein LguiB_005840 [Lonicera macranthoides]
MRLLLFFSYVDYIFTCGSEPASGYNYFAIIGNQPEELTETDISQNTLLLEADVRSQERPKSETESDQKFSFISSRRTVACEMCCMSEELR